MGQPQENEDVSCGKANARMAMARVIWAHKIVFKSCVRVGKKIYRSKEKAQTRQGIVVCQL